MATARIIAGFALDGKAYFDRSVVCSHRKGCPSPGAVRNPFLTDI
ncbi:MAG: hypothetical protein ABIK83_15955 [Candidatus Zixiibacteriota bacterium]